MANKELLTAAEYEAYRPHPEMVRRIEACRARFGVPKADFRILDWGCGRGALVLWLRQRGYDARGVDIDPEPFANGSERFAELGMPQDQCLKVLDSESRAPFPDSHFHFVVSWQTVEHISDLRGVVDELRRL